MQGRRTKANRTLLKPFSKDDIKDSLFRMHPSKAPSVGWHVCGFLSKALAQGW